MGEPSGTFTFTKVFGPDASQKELFDFTTRPLVEKLFKGQNGLIFAYGITNSGKTFTMQGTESHPGVMTNMLMEVFKRIDNAKNDQECDIDVIDGYVERIFIYLFIYLIYLIFI